MSNQIQKLHLLATALLLVAGSAAADVITFDSYPVLDNDLQSGTITTQNFNFTADSFYIVNMPGDCAGGCVDDGSPYVASTGSTITITRSANLPFSLVGLDAARLFLTPGGIGSFPNADTLDVVGTLMNGSTVSKSLTLPLEGSFGTFTLAGFQDLSSLAISGTAGGIDGASWAADNIALTAIPEPGDFLLVAPALAAMFAWVRFRRRWSAGNVMS